MKKVLLSSVATLAVLPFLCICKGENHLTNWSKKSFLAVQQMKLTLRVTHEASVMLKLKMIQQL